MSLLCLFLSVWDNPAAMPRWAFLCENLRLQSVDVNFLEPAELNYGGGQIPKKGEKFQRRATIDVKVGVQRGYLIWWSREKGGVTAQVAYSGICAPKQKRGEKNDLRLFRNRNCDASRLCN